MEKTFAHCHPVKGVNRAKRAMYRGVVAQASEARWQKIPLDWTP